MAPFALGDGTQAPKTKTIKRRSFVQKGASSSSPADTPFLAKKQWRAENADNDKKNQKMSLDEMSPLEILSDSGDIFSEILGTQRLKFVCCRLC